MRTDAITTAAGATGILLFAGGMLVLGPFLQLEEEPPTPGLFPYSEAEARGREQYVALGCAYCHSQQPRDPSQAPDMERGWGRPSVPGDYVYDYPHQLGTMRTGPDLLNVGARLASEDWHLLHLYQPRAVVEGSVMPSYPFLFTVVDEPGPEDRVLNLPPELRAGDGEVVATPAALDLVAYLLALDHTGAAFDREELQASERGEEDPDGTR